MRTRPSGFLKWAVLVAAAATLIAGCGKKDDSISQAAKKDETKGIAAPSISATKAIAEEGYLYGLPLVMNYAVMYQFAVNKDSGQYKGPFNTVVNQPGVYTYKDTAAATPNSDTPFSFDWMDLRAEPIILSVPAVPTSRYYSVQLVDGNTFIFGYIGTRATGPDAGDYMVVGPDWKGQTPTGIKEVFQSSTQFAAALYRTQLFNSADMPNVAKVQAGYTAQPLSAYLKQPAPAAAPAIDFPKIDKEMVKTNFFDYLDFVLQFAPGGPEEEGIRAKLATIGVGPGKSFSFKNLSIEHKAAILLAMKEGDNEVDKYLTSGVQDINGWEVDSLFGDRTFYSGDWRKRAAAVKANIYGNNEVEAVYALSRGDAKGEKLDGSKHKYTLTFAKGELPPVNAFWSVTMYDGKTQLLIENPINRYLVNSSMLSAMRENPDGSLTVYIQNKTPGEAKEANWLPAPDGPIYMVMRLYWPKDTPPSILPPGFGTWKPPPIWADK